MEELTQQQIDERVAVLRRFRSLLEQQRSKFREYLVVLEKQQNSITADNTETLAAHTELEQQVVANITSLQKVIVPMAELYASTGAAAVSPAAQETVEKIQSDLSLLQIQVTAQNKKNRDLLRVHIEQIKTQMNQMQNPYRNNRSIYAVKQPVATIIQVDA